MKGVRLHAVGPGMGIRPEEGWDQLAIPPGMGLRPDEGWDQINTPPGL